jgi:universal stress protein A
VSPIKTILHATDFSDPSRPAFDTASAMANDFGAELIVCHVAPPAAVAAGGERVPELPAEEIAQARVRLEQLRPRHSHVRVTHRLLRGDPVGEIVRLAGDVKADLVVMGAHGRTALGRSPMGSVAEAVTRNAPCPVITVEAPLPAGQPESPAGRLATA